MHNSIAYVNIIKGGTVKEDDYAPCCTYLIILIEDIKIVKSLEGTGILIKGIT